MSDLELAIHEAIDDRLLDVHTSLPARVVSYDAAKQIATLKPGTWTQGFPIDTLYDVPVLHPRAQGVIVHIPLQPGDWCLLLFAETSLARWRAQQTEGAEPDPQRHSLNGALALPLGTIAPVAGLSASDVTIAADDYIRMGSVNPSDKMALAGKVLTELQRIKSDLDALKVELLAHQHTGVTTGPGTSGPPAALVWSPTGPGSVESAKVKAD